MSENGEPRFREPKAVYQERELVEKAIPRQPNTTIFGEWQISRSVIAPVLDPGGLYKGYKLHKVAQLSTSVLKLINNSLRKYKGN